MNGPLNQRVAASGQTATFPDLSTGYAIPMVAPLSGGATPDLLLQGGAPSIKMATGALALAWNTPVAEAINGMGGAFASCAGAGRFVTPAVSSATLRSYAGLTGALTGERVLAGGAAYPSVAAAIAAGAVPGSLSNASSVADLGGGGPAVLVGSSDGYLYAVDACTLDLRWAKFLNAPVAEPVIGDVDGDGEDEIVVGVSSGFVVGLDDAAFPPPLAIQIGGEATDGIGLNDPSKPIIVSWGSVEGASGYELALVSPDDRPLWDPPYRAVPGTSTDIALDGVLAARPYRVVVRAVGTDRAGAEGFSPSFRVVDTQNPTLGVQPTGVADGADFALTAADDIALDYAALTWIPEPGAEPLFATDGMLSGKSASATLHWSPPGEAWGTSVVLVTSVVDSAGNLSQSEVSARVDESGSVSFDDPPIPRGGSDPVASGASPEGCACRIEDAPSRDGAPAGLFAAAMIALGAVLRRRRRNA